MAEVGAADFGLIRLAVEGLTNLGSAAGKLRLEQCGNHYFMDLAPQLK